LESRKSSAAVLSSCGRGDATDPYFNVLFEDKAGFDPEEDWAKVKQVFLEYYPEAAL